MAIIDTEKQQRERLGTLFNLISELSEAEQLELIHQIEAKKKNLRKSTRKPFHNEVTYAIDKAAHQEFISDISTTGLFIETEIPVTVGKRISLTFPVDTTDKHLKLSGEIVRKSQDGIGVKFHPLTREAQTSLHNLIDSL